MLAKIVSYAWVFICNTMATYSSCSTDSNTGNVSAISLRDLFMMPQLEKLCITHRRSDNHIECGNYQHDAATFTQ